MFSRSIRYVVAALAITSLPAFAYADSSHDGRAPSEHVREKKGEKAQFPMKADEFRGRVEQRITKTRERIVAKMKEKNVAADKQDKILAKFDEGAKQVRDLTDKVCADGTVTKEEAKSVHELARSLRREAQHKKGHGKEARRERREHKKQAA